MTRVLVYLRPEDLHYDPQQDRRFLASTGKRRLRRLGRALAKQYRGKDEELARRWAKVARSS